MKKLIIASFVMVALIMVNHSVSAGAYAVAVVSPNGGEAYAYGNPITITWRHYFDTSASTKIALAYYQEVPGATSYPVIQIATNLANTGSYTWYPPSTLKGTGYKILIGSTYNGSGNPNYDFMEDTSDGTFTIQDAYQNTSLPGAVPATYGLKEGDLVGANSVGDPDIFIINTYGYKRLFLNPIIFGFYGHLGGYAKVKPISATARDQFQTSLYFKNCETNDGKIWALEVTGEDTGMLHYINMSGPAASAQDANIFIKSFCINNREFNWYQKGADYTSLSQVKQYDRGGMVNCTGFEVLFPSVSNDTGKVTFTIRTANCIKGVAIEVSNTATFTNPIDVGRLYATGQQTLVSDFCGWNVYGAEDCIDYVSGQQLYYRVVDLATKNVIVTGTPFRDVVTPYSAASKARDTKRLADINQIRTAIELYFDDNGIYPSDITDAYVGKYFSAGTTPKDPSTNAPYGYAHDYTLTKYQVWTLLENNNAYTLLNDSDISATNLGWTPRPANGNQDITCASVPANCIFDLGVQ